MIQWSVHFEAEKTLIIIYHANIQVLSAMVVESRIGEPMFRIMDVRFINI